MTEVKRKKKRSTYDRCGQGEAKGSRIGGGGIQGSSDWWTEVMDGDGGGLLG